MNYQIFPLGDNALTIEFCNEISVEINNNVLKLARFFEVNSFEGFIEIVPAYSSLTVFYDVYKIKKNDTESSTAFDKVKNFVESTISTKLDEFQKQNFRTLEIPVSFEPEFSPDLKFVAKQNNVSAEEVIKIFLGKTYRVFMLGFLPGFSYMGEIDEKISVPRKLSPRLRVPAGSVGIAGRQTGIYSLESPGGWQIIGQTPLQIFTPDKEIPTFLQAGDSVKFYEIDKKTFLKLQSAK